MKLLITPEAKRDYAALPLTFQARVRRISAKLVDWPNISGAKPLRSGWKGCFRIRTGDWRIIVRPLADVIWIVRIAHRREVYED